MTKFLVVKIGGSILKNSKSYLDAALKITDYLTLENKMLVVVVSAAKGVTDSLINACEGNRTSLGEVSGLYLEIARNIGGYNLEVIVQRYLRELENVVKLSSFCESTIKDIALSYGERISKALLLDALKNENVKVVDLNALELVIARKNSDSVVIDYESTKVRVPVIEGHTEVVFVEYEEGFEFEVDDVVRALREFKSNKVRGLGLPTAPDKPVVVVEALDKPQPRLDRFVNNGMTVVVGRIRVIKSLNMLKYVVVGNNLVRGAAGTGVLIAELLTQYLHKSGGL